MYDAEPGGNRDARDPRTRRPSRGTRRHVNRTGSHDADGGADRTDGKVGAGSPVERLGARCPAGRVGPGRPVERIGPGRPVGRSGAGRPVERSGAGRPVGRRRLLAAGATVGAAALTGCLDAVSPGGGGSTRGDVIHLDTLDVGGSPGGTVPLRPPETLSLLDFFATWCGPCRPQMSTLGRVRDRFDEDDLHMVSVTTESDEAAVGQFWREYDGAWPVALDQEATAQQAYAVKGIPTLVVVDPDGTEHWRHRGLADFETLGEEVQAALDA
jgi:thiol-disulfide isomerase/thioredoxin